MFYFSPQKCSPGYYRDSSNPYLGRCVPCQCNGLADECDERTGRCLVRVTPSALWHTPKNQELMTWVLELKSLSSRALWLCVCHTHTHAWCSPCPGIRILAFIFLLDGSMRLFWHFEMPASNCYVRLSCVSNTGTDPHPSKLKS